jgi:hypothetical protein
MYQGPFNSTYLYAPNRHYDNKTKQTDKIGNIFVF